MRECETISIAKEVKDEFRRYCILRGLNKSRFIENYMKSVLKNWEGCSLDWENPNLK